MKQLLVTVLVWMSGDDDEGIKLIRISSEDLLWSSSVLELDVCVKSEKVLKQMFEDPKTEAGCS